MSLLRTIIVLIGVCVVTVGAQTIYQITSTNQTYNYTTHDYNGSPGSLPGVAFRFTAPAVGSYTIVVEDVESTSKYILDYGSDQTFTTLQDYTGPATGALSRSFTASSTDLP